MAKEKQLTLEELAKYNQEVLFPFMKENFVAKKDFDEFEDDSMKFQDKALDDLETLKQEKIFGGAQDKRKTKVLEIHNDALKTSKILSEQQATEIDGLRVF